MTKPNITPAHVANLANLFSPSDIADILKIPQSRVEELLDEAGTPRETWEVRCNKTGKTWQTRSRRSAYRLVCLHGLVDWDWRRV